MKIWMDTCLVLVVLTNILLLGSSRLGMCIRLVAIQGVLLGLFPLLVHASELSLRLCILTAGILLLKGAVFPWLLSRAIRAAHVMREVEPFVGYATSMLAGILSLVLCLWLATRLPLPVPTPTSLLVPVTLSTILVGLFLIVSRKKALTQVLGYLTMESGIYAFGVALALQEPLLIEMGVLLNVFVGVFVMGIAIFHISREFDHMDADRLSELKD